MDIFIVSFSVLCAFIMIDAAPIPLEMVDMSYVFDNNTLHKPKTEKFRLILKHNGTTEKGFWLQSDNYSSGVHVGTHIDAPCHFAKGRWCVDQIPLDHLVAPAAVIDVTKQTKNDSDYLVKVDDLMKWEILSGKSLDSTIVMLRSGWGRRWGDRESFTGTTGNDTTQLHFPGMSEEASKWLIENRSIYGLGTETLSIDSGQSRDFKTHRVLNEGNVFGLENVANMEEIPLYGATLYVMPMKIRHASGAPVRIIATFPKPIFATEGGKTATEGFLREVIIFH
ncbi:isatin hydrolase-like [Parasteatoda tepidariorum]|uniref:isatin hydrolase-like n=1 Tax=Parasteatoda tepidariorum TaxID=114398 RepID=UPI00077FD3AA|nr:isatin hydrolase-like [Parasteatoda tepidariorum]XP_015923068.1 isatin hydrolase-like [Parasteatoda tepidariorum]